MSKIDPREIADISEFHYLSRGQKLISGGQKSIARGSDCDKSIDAASQPTRKISAISQSSRILKHSGWGRRHVMKVYSFFAHLASVLIRTGILTSTTVCWLMSRVADDLQRVACVTTFPLVRATSTYSSVDDLERETIKKLTE
jgi:hypothetical protein